MTSHTPQTPAPHPPLNPTLPPPPPRASCLQVDYSGFSTINTQRFGQKFVGKVANPNDMVLWQKAPQRKAKARGGGAPC